MRAIFFANAGHIPVRQSALNAVTQWANDCERKVLIRLSCGIVLPRDRHRAWATEELASARFLMGREGSGYALIGKAAAREAAEQEQPA
jgi:hypothetical protein